VSVWIENSACVGLVGRWKLFLFFYFFYSYFLFFLFFLFFELESWRREKSSTGQGRAGPALPAGYSKE
jgi:hypothetical protein